MTVKFNTITVICEKNGRLKHALENITLEDSVRWSEEGYQVFIIAATDRQWAINHVNTGSVSTSDAARVPDSMEQAMMMLALKGGR